MVVSIIRTVVPAAVGFVITWLLSLTGIDLSEFSGPVTEMFIVLIVGLYYLLARWLERNHSDKWGWLLGSPTQPLYPSETSAVVVSPSTPPTVIEGSQYDTFPEDATL